MKRIGVLGGTFNPIHVGHLTIAQIVCEQFKLDKVIFIPTYLPPHKSSKNVIAALDRYHMVCLAIKDNPFFEVSDFEIKKQGKSYSIDTIEYLQEKYQEGTKFFFIIGEDHLSALHTWRRSEDLLKKVSFVCVNRPGFKGDKTKIKVKFVEVQGLQTSSTDIRRRLGLNKTIKYLVLDNVCDYIKRKKLYTRK